MRLSDHVHRARPGTIYKHTIKSTFPGTNIRPYMYVSTPSFRQLHESEVHIPDFEFGDELRGLVLL